MTREPSSLMPVNKNVCPRVCPSKLPVFPAKVDELRLPVLPGRPHLACFGIGLDDQVPRRVIAEIFSLPLGIHQPEERFSLSCSKLNDWAHGSTSCE